MGGLLVIIPDRVTDILIKGEFQPLYYNPGNLFDEVHILMTNDDRPDGAALQRTVGTARLFVHNHDEQPELIRRDWQADDGRLLKRWAEPAVELALRIDPELIRCHGADWNIFLARHIKDRLGIPYLVSLHINPDVNSPRRYLGGGLALWQQRHNAFFEFVEREGLRGADLVMPVYQAIEPYLRRLDVTRFEVCYNILNRDYLSIKTDYTLHRPPRILSVGRLFQEKNPDNLIRAVAGLEDVILTVVGDGPQRPALQALAEEIGVAARVVFEPAVPNDELCRRLPEYDLFAVHTEYWELNKSVLEALLTGLPVVINHRHGDPVPELNADIVLKVDNSPDGYRSALASLLSDDDAREALGRRAGAHARAHWDPAITEAKVVGRYRQYRRA